MKKTLILTLAILILISSLLPFAAEASDAKALSAPVITNLEAVKNGIRLSWGKVNKAEKYRVFRKDNGKWKKLGDTFDTVWTNKAVEFGGTYTYTVRCISKSGDSYTSGYDKNGRTLDYLPAPNLAALSAVYSGLRLKWNSVDGSEGYRVFAKINGKWKKLGDTSAGTLFFTDTSVTSGQSRAYTVRCITASGDSYTSFYDTEGMSALYNSVPDLLGAASVSGGLKITWSKVYGAAKYRVFRRENGKWKKLGDTADTHWTNKSVTEGAEYTYTVRCISSDGGSYTSDYDKSGVTARYVKPASSTPAGVRGKTAADVLGMEAENTYRGSNPTKTTAITSELRTNPMTAATRTATVKKPTAPWTERARRQ